MDLVGTTLGNYRIDRLLGEGGMGAVYQAYDLTLQRDVAIKLIHPHVARQVQFRERFMQEARIMAHLDHPGIVKVYLLGKEGDLLYLPMEFIKGGNLRQLLDELSQEQRWLPLGEAILLIQQLCQVVQYAHHHGVLHRDIKPANLMLKPEPTDGLPFRVILTDLGLAKLVQGLGLTEEGTSLGTPAYMSPEQALGKPTDPRSDVYSLGILLYEVAAGRLPFLIRSTTEAMRYHSQVPPPDPCSINSKIPAALRNVILKALEKDPDQRFPSAAALGAALAGTLIHATEIAKLADPGEVSLITKYQDSAFIPQKTKPSPISLMTMLGHASIEPRGASVFGDQSISQSPETRLQIISKDKDARFFALPPGTITIGRGPENQIVLDDGKASRKHAQITWDGMECRVMDLNSRNGTYLENTRLLAGISEILRPDQNLRIGDTWLRVILSAARASNISGSRRIPTNHSLLTNSSAGAVGVSVTPRQLAVEAGGIISANVSLLNQSPNVDHFSLSISGIPSDWITSLPPSVQLMPGEQKEVAFTLQVPRAPQSHAGPHHLILKVISQSNPNQFVDFKLTLTVAAYSQFKTQVQPQRLKAGQTGRVILFNNGNLQEVFTVQFQDAANELSFQPPRLQVKVPAGASATAEYQAQDSQRRWIGSEKSKLFNVQVSLPKGESQTLQAEMLSRGLFPVWVPPIMLLLCCLFAFAGAKIIPPLVFPPPALTWTPTSTPAISPQETFTAIPSIPTTTMVIPVTVSTTTTLTPTQTLTVTQTGIPTLTPTLTQTTTPTYTPTSTQTKTPTFTSIPVGDGRIYTWVYWDRNNNGSREGGEDLLSATLQLYAGTSCSGSVLATVGQFFGGYTFLNLQAGTYCIKVVNNSVDSGGICPLTPGRFGDTKVYTLVTNDQTWTDSSGFPYVCQ